MDVVLELKLNQKWIDYLAYTNVANENCVKFCMKEVFNVRLISTPIKPNGSNGP
jgi:hypothetical protein